MCFSGNRSPSSNKGSNQPPTRTMLLPHATDQPREHSLGFRIGVRWQHDGFAKLPRQHRRWHPCAASQSAAATTCFGGHDGTKAERLFFQEQADAQVSAISRKLELE